MTRYAASPLRPYLSVVSLCYAWSSALSKLAVFLWVLLCTKVEAQNVTAEMEALEAFQSRTAITFQVFDGRYVAAYEPRGYWDSWNTTDKSPCRWVGISCTINGSVRSLDLSGWGLTKLDTYGLEQLSPLQNLQRLILSGNRFNDRIPDSVGTLTNLRHLDLSDSSFTERLPSSLNQLRHLRSLYLDGNSFTGGIPLLDNLTQLQVLSLSQNQLEGSIPNHLNSLSSLVNLDLSSNRFNGSVPVLTNLVNLDELNLENNNLTGFIDPRFPGPRSLKHLFTSGNQLRGNLPVGLTEMLELESLDMSSNMLSDEIPKGLARQTSHNYWLDLSQNLLEGRIPEDLFLPSSVFRAFSLNLSYNNLSGNIPEVQNVTDGWYFAALDLSHNQLNGSLPLQFFSERFTAHGMWLQSNQLSGDIVDVLPTLLDHGVQDIRLANNRFTGDLTRMIGKWKNGSETLEIIDLSNNLLTMSKTRNYPDPLRGTMENLLSSPFLRDFRIAGNHLEGISLPERISVPARNHGEPPLSLEVLDVSNNHLVGSIAAEVYDRLTFPAIRVLNFSSNNLTGPVPYSITRLPRLITLDVSWNNLSGRLPEIPPRSTLWDANLLVGNPGLCGRPLPECSPRRPPLIVIIVKGNSLSKGALSAIILSSVLVPLLASCFLVGWRWRVYKKIHKQDADLIATLSRRDTTTLMPLRDLKRATNNFAESAQIGEGGFGTVYIGKLQDGTTVAVKRSKQEGSEASKQQFLNEVRVLCEVSHRHLVKLLGCCMEKKAALLVFEFVPNGTLKEHLQGKKGSRLSWKQRLEIAMQTADALNYLHSIPIVHRDVKSANILLTEKLKVKVADFGISKLVSAETAEATHFSTLAIQGTMGYIDPEYFTSCQLTVKSDVYSFGVVLLELISAQPALDFQRPSGDSSLITFAAPLIQNQELESLIDPVLKDSFDVQMNCKESVMSVGTLALQCLQDRSKDRPDMKEVWKQLQTAWLSYEGSSDLLDAPFSIHVESNNTSEGSSTLLWNPKDSKIEEEKKQK